nr:MAG TPA: hypothetical protein [Caudoviricetes sp.]
MRFFINTALPYNTSNRSSFVSFHYCSAISIFKTNPKTLRL